MKKFGLLIAAVIIGLSFYCNAFAANHGKDSEEASEGTKIIPKKVSVDTVGDGKPHRFEYYDDKGNIAKIEFDKVGDGIIDETIIYENGKPVKGWKDTKRSGKPDVWVDYQ